ncbi:MAG: GntR family transcriptional regulator [Victivallaceae bacterium]
MITTVKRSSKRKISNLAGRLRDQILNGKLAAGIALPTAEELAKRSGASAITINRIMAKLAEEGLVNRIKGKGTFVVDKEKIQQKHTIGISFLIPDGSTQEVSAAFTVFQESAASTIKELGHEICYLPLPELRDNSERGKKLLDSADALVISASCLCPEVIHLLLDYHKPCVVIQQTASLALPFHQVAPELSTGFIAALNRFRELGQTRISVVSKTGGTHTGRALAFIQCAVTMGFAAESLELVQDEPVMADFGRMYGYKIGRKILTEKLSRTIFSTSDFFSFGIIDAFNEVGLKPGLDYNLISFDDLEGEGLCPFGVPLITTITFPKRKIARAAVKLALSLISRPSNYFETVRVPTTLINRETC